MKRKPDKSRSRRSQERNEPASSDHPSLSTGRKWLFRFILIVVVPLLALGAVEAGLRLAGYGHPTGLFKEVDIGGHEFLVNDDHFSMRFFPEDMTRSPAALRMEPRKPEGVFRIFIFGESAAMGDPEPAFGAGRYLEVLLRERFPGEKFEVINLGITAINSHVVLPIARECADKEGDVWIVYMGNNEMVGPFGAATVFGAQAPPLAFVRLSLAIQKTRVGQLLMAVGRKMKHSDSRTWGGMKMFVENKVRPDDPRREVVYHNFQGNLRDILRAGLGSGARVLLNTVAVNLKDNPPFASLGKTNLAASGAESLARLSADAAMSESNRDFATAAKDFKEAANLDPLSAELQYHLGECELELNKEDDARQHLQSACDLDALPFRADSRINGSILGAGKKIAGENLRLFDAASALGTNADGVCGLETFYEHVHFNFDGSYRLARAWAAQIEPWLPESAKKNAAAQWASQETCEARLGLTDWNRSGVVESVIRRMYDAPLSTQANNPQRIAALQTRLNELHRRMNNETAPQALAIYEDALRRAPDDYFLHENFAGFLEARGDLEKATEEWQRAHELMPQDFVADFQLANVLMKERKLTNAETVLVPSLAAHPGFTEGWTKLGEIHAAESRLELARTEFERAKKLRPEDPEIPYQLGMVFSRLNHSEESLQNFREAVRLKPSYWEAHYTLGGELGMHNQIGEARQEFEMVIRLNPKFPGAHLNLGVALLKEGHLDEARDEFEKTLELEPENKIARTYLHEVEVMKARRK